jgi:hypothetical protein
MTLSINCKDAGDPVCTHTMYGETEEELLKNAKEHGIKIFTLFKGCYWIFGSKGSRMTFCYLLEHKEICSNDIQLFCAGFMIIKSMTPGTYYGFIIRNNHTTIMTLAALSIINNGTHSVPNV